MKFNVTEVEFDFTDSQGELDEWEQDQIVNMLTMLMRLCK